MNEGNIGLDYLFVKELRNFMQKYGYIVATSLGDSFANIAAHKEGVGAENILVLRLAIFGRSFGMHMTDSYILQLIALAVHSHRIQEHIRSAGSTLCKDGVACNIKRYDMI